MITELEKPLSITERRGHTNHSLFSIDVYIYVAGNLTTNYTNFNIQKVFVKLWLCRSYYKTSVGAKIHQHYEAPPVLRWAEQHRHWTTWKLPGQKVFREHHLVVEPGHAGKPSSASGAVSPSRMSINPFKWVTFNVLLQNVQVTKLIMLRKWKVRHLRHVLFSDEESPG